MQNQPAFGHARGEEKTGNTLCLCHHVGEPVATHKYFLCILILSRKRCTVKCVKRAAWKDTLILPLQGFRAISLRWYDDTLQNNVYKVDLETETEELTGGISNKQGKHSTHKTSCWVKFKISNVDETWKETDRDNRNLHTLKLVFLLSRCNPFGWTQTQRRSNKIVRHQQEMTELNASLTTRCANARSSDGWSAADAAMRLDFGIGGFEAH